MRPEKQYLVAEVARHLDKSKYLYLADFDRMSVADTADLRDRLAEQKAEFHVVKNSVLHEAAKLREFPELGKWLDGPTAIVVGGENAPGVAKTLIAYYKEHEKIVVKGGFLDKKALDSKDIRKLALLPSIEVLRGQLLALLNAPALGLLRVFQAVPKGIIYALMARSAKGESSTEK